RCLRLGEDCLRKQLSGRQNLVQLSHALECVQAPHGGPPRARTRRNAWRQCPASLRLGQGSARPPQFNRRLKNMIRFIDADGCALRVQGGPASAEVVLVHELAGSSDSWSALRPWL